jgi:hypothetical protein
MDRFFQYRRVPSSLDRLILRCFFPPWQIGIVVVCTLILVALPNASNAQTFTISPSSLAFGSQTVGTFSHNTITLLNTGNTNLTLNSFTLEPAEFQLVNGYAPAVLGPERAMYFTIAFAPDAAQNFSGQLTINIQGIPPQVVPLSGQGLTTGAVAQVSASALDFGSIPLGTTSAARTLTLKNAGTSTMSLLGVNSDPPFSANGFSPPIILNAGESTTLPITMSGFLVGSYPGEVTLSFDVLPTKAVSLYGTVVAASKFAVSTFPTLPSASTGASYLANLLAVDGTAPYTWALTKGSSLPAGLALTSAGSITGAIASTQTVGSYPFSVQVSDSSSPVKTAKAALILPVATAPPLPDCANIVYPNVSAPLIPINDLGSGTYLGEEGGLYPNGSNVRPAAQDAAGVSIAQAIQPLDADGNPNSNGKYVLISIGNSEAQQEFLQFLGDADADPATNPHLVVVNGAQDALLASDWANITSGAWPTLSNILLPQAGVTANQVVAAWIKAFDIPSGTFPANEAGTQADLESIAQNLHTLFPNIKLAYYASRIYGGYANGTQSAQDGEPDSYETSFPIKWAIQDQIDGLASLNFDPTKGTVRAPWLSWEAYDWANGMLARSDGLVWTCQDFLDGGHPSAPAGREKDANLFLSFLKTDDSTRPWFLNPAQTVLLSSSSLNFGNQAVGTTSTAHSISLTNNQAVPLAVSSIVATGDFAATNNCGSSVVAGGNCKISVTFTPAKVGKLTGSLTIADNAASSPQIVKLSGTGVTSSSESRIPQPALIGTEH